MAQSEVKEANSTEVKRQLPSGPPGIDNQELERTQGLCVKLSNIPDAGWGVFATKLFKKGSVITTYTGKVTPKYPEGVKDNTYIVRIPGVGYIDATDPSIGGIGRYVNDRTLSGA